MPAHDKTYNKTCATIEDSDQPAHPRSLIRVFANRLCRLRPPGYPKRDKREPLPYWVDVQGDLSSCCLYTSYCRICHALLIFLVYRIYCSWDACLNKSVDFLLDLFCIDVIYAMFCFVFFCKDLYK